MSYEIGTGFTSFCVDFANKGSGEYCVLINGKEAFYIYSDDSGRDIQQEIIGKFQEIVDEYSI